MNLIVSSIGQGLLWALLGLGLYLTFRILDFADMTVEGTFPLGAASAVAGNFNCNWCWNARRFDHWIALH